MSLYPLAHGFFLPVSTTKLRIVIPMIARSVSTIQTTQRQQAGAETSTLRRQSFLGQPYGLPSMNSGSKQEKGMDLRQLRVSSAMLEMEEAYFQRHVASYLIGSSTEVVLFKRKGQTCSRSKARELRKNPPILQSLIIC